MFENTFKISFAWAVEQKPKILILEDQKICIRGCEEFENLGIQMDKEHTQEEDIKKIIIRGRTITATQNKQKTKQKNTNIELYTETRS